LSSKSTWPPDNVSLEMPTEAGGAESALFQRGTRNFVAAAALAIGRAGHSVAQEHPWRAARLSLRR
jgi:hypothetical protein